MLTVRVRRPGREAAELPLRAPVTAFLGRGARELVRALGGARTARVDAAVTAEPDARRPRAALVRAEGGPPRWRRVDRHLRRAARAGRRRGGSPDELDRIVQAFELGAFVGDRGGSLPPAARRRAALASAVLGRPELLLVDLALAEPADVRRDTWTLLRWVREARPCTIAYVAHGTRDLEDLADEAVVVDHGGIFGPAEPWELLGRTLRGGFAEEFTVESLLRAAVDYLDEDGRWLRVLVAGNEVYLPFERLSPGHVGRVAVRPESVVLLREPLPGPRLTNQLAGTIRAVGDLFGRHRVDVELGEDSVLRAAVEPDTVRAQGFAPGSRVVCAFEPAAVRWIG